MQEILGTSAGSLTGALVAAGLSSDDLMRREQRLKLSASGKKVMNRVDASGSATRRARPTFGFGLAQAPQLLWPALRRPGSVSPGTIAAGFLPRGQYSTAAIGETVDAVLLGQWPTEPRLRCVAVSLADGRRRIFSIADADTGETNCSVTPGTAVAASCAVPGMYRPVVVGDSEFIDGATHSANHVDAIGRHDVVIVSSPSTATRGTTSLGPWSVARRSLATQLKAEVRALGADTDVIVIEPDQAMLDVMGTDPMAMSNRAGVAMAAYHAATEIFRARSNPLVKVTS